MREDLRALENAFNSRSGTPGTPEKTPPPLPEKPKAAAPTKEKREEHRKPSQREERDAKYEQFAIEGAREVSRVTKALFDTHGKFIDRLATIAETAHKKHGIPLSDEAIKAFLVRGAITEPNKVKPEQEDVKPQPSPSEVLLKEVRWAICKGIEAHEKATGKKFDETFVNLLDPKVKIEVGEKQMPYVDTVQRAKELEQARFMNETLESLVHKVPKLRQGASEKWDAFIGELRQSDALAAFIGKDIFGLHPDRIPANRKSELSTPATPEQHARVHNEQETKYMEAATRYGTPVVARITDQNGHTKDYRLNIIFAPRIEKDSAGNRIAGGKEWIEIKSVYVMKEDKLTDGTVTVAGIEKKNFPLDKIVGGNKDGKPGTEIHSGAEIPKAIMDAITDPANMEKYVNDVPIMGDVSREVFFEYLLGRAKESSSLWFEDRAKDGTLKPKGALTQK